MQVSVHDSHSIVVDWTVPLRREQAGNHMSDEGFSAEDSGRDFSGRKVRRQGAVRSEVVHEKGRMITWGSIDDGFASKWARVERSPLCNQTGEER